MKYLLLTSLALIAFAGNSILGRLALSNNSIDALSFTWIRLISGSLMLMMILKTSQKTKTTTIKKPSWKGAFMLLTYATSFSYAYLILEAGTGTLILFAAVQATIIITGLIRGERFHSMEYLGATLAFAGFIYLVLPNFNKPSLAGFLAMTASGIAWGFYTLEGKKSQNSLSDTVYNFSRTIPFISLFALLSLPKIQANSYGIALAIASGAITSGLGYSIWFSALKGLSTIQAAVVQLLVPVLATIGGIIFINEKLTIELISSTLLILGGIFIVIYTKFKVATKSPQN